MVEKRKYNRRDFMAAAGAVTAGTLLPSCSKDSKNAAGPDSSEGNADVSLAKITTYLDYSKVKSTVETMLDQIGGISDVIKSGDSVAIKINLTGGGSWVENKLGARAEESIWTHSFVLRAVGEALKDAGAGKLYVVEGQSDEVINDFNFGYKAALIQLGATFVSLNGPAPQGSYVSLPVSNGYNFDSFTVNSVLQDVDAYVTIPKMKCHYTAGITLAMKNSVGMVPGTVYGNGTRWNLHGTNGNLKEAGWHLPGSIIDLNLARPIDLAVIDGISTMDRGEGSWVPGFTAPFKAGALVAGKNPVQTDAIAMKVMGFDPLTPHYQSPFVVSENWLLKAQEKGLGNPDPDTIITAGAKFSDFTMKFHACAKNPEVIGKPGYHRMAPYCGQHPNDLG